MTFAAGPTSEVRSGWGWFVGFGIVLAILGIIALWNAVDATLVTTIVIGWLLIGGGIASIIGAFTMASSTGWRILQVVLGLLYIVVGFNIIADPLAGAITLIIVVSLMLIIDGISRLVLFFMGRSEGGWLMVAFAILNILLGIWLWTDIPFSGIAIGIFVGLQLLFAGMAWIVLGWAGRAVEGPAATA